MVNQALRGRASSGGRPALWYWRTREGHEVDLLMQDGGKLWLAEAKAAENPSRGDAAALERFIAADPGSVSRAHLVCRTGREFPLSKAVTAVPGRAWPRG